MAINVKNLLNNGEFRGVLQGYKIEKETVKPLTLKKDNLM